METRVESRWTVGANCGFVEPNLVLHPILTVADSKSLSNKRKSAIKAPAMAPGMTGIGKKPPQAVELEEAVLGACMLESSAVNAVIDALHRAGMDHVDHIDMPLTPARVWAAMQA